ncbi:MAG: CoA transferase [Chloroflexota bacterium]|nr:CoA transferase [Chloroflexota bacterium]
MVEQALSDMKILDLSWYIAGPYCAKYFADFGADVLKIEKPGGGDPARGMGPFYKDDPHPEKSGTFLLLNTNKKGITLNLKSSTGKKIFKELVKDADMVVESFRPHVMPSLGLSYQELEKINPKLVMVSISNFGQTGPYREYLSSELVLNGMGHAMYGCGLADREPAKLGGTILEFQSGTVAAQIAMVAFYAARYQGVSQHVDVSIMETELGSVDRRHPMLVISQYWGEKTSRGELTAGMGFPFGTFPCKDGFFGLAGGMAWFGRTCNAIGVPELAGDPYWDGPSQFNMERRDEFYARYWYPWVTEHTKRECFVACQDAGVLCAPLNTVEDLFWEPHFEKRDYWIEVDHPYTGKLKYPGHLIKSEETPWLMRRRAPLLGEHNAEIYSELGYSKQDMVRLRELDVI